MGRRIGNNREFWWNANKNRRTENMYFFQLLDMAINVFDWKNLPDNIDPRFMELTLINKGHILFFKDDDLLQEKFGDVIPDSDGRYLCLPCTLGGKWDVYNTPILRRAYATNGYQKHCTNKDSVIIYNNYLRQPDIYVIRQFADRLYEIQRTIDVNVKSQKTPLMIVTDDNTRLTMKNFYKQYDGNEPYITVDKSFDLDGVKVFRTDSPYVASNLQDLKHEIFNEALTYFGISNISSVKKERLITDEVTRNLGGTEVEKHVRLNARKDACKLINEMYGLDIDVEYNSQLDIVVDATQAFDTTKQAQNRGDDYNE